MDDVIGGDDVAGDRNAGVPQARTAKGRVADVTMAKQLGRQLRKQLCRARQGSYTVFVIDFHLLNQDIFFFGVQFRSQRADGLQCCGGHAPETQLRSGSNPC